MMRRLLLPLFALLTACPAMAQIDLAKDFIIVGESAYGMLAPSVVAGADVRQACFSGDGQFVYAIRSDDKLSQFTLNQMLKGTPPTVVPEETLVVYNVKTAHSTDLYKLTAGQGTFQSIQGFAAGGSAIVQMTLIGKQADGTPAWAGQTAIVTPSRLTPIDRGDYLPALTVSRSKAKPYAAIIKQSSAVARGAKATFTMTVYDMNARLVQTSTLPSGVTPNILWTENGTAWLYSQDLGTDSKPKPRFWYTMNVETGQVTPSQTKPDLKPSSTPILDLRMGELGGQGARDAEEVPAIYMVAETEKVGVLVGTQTGHVWEIAPTQDSVLYTSQGVALVRPIVKLPKQLVLEALKAAEKTKILSNTKQVALALIMFTADNDDNFPGAGFDFATQLEPYTKNRSLLNGFVYTFGGGNASAIEKPAETEIGYMMGPGGRAVAYADGHVKWIPDKP